MIAASGALALYFERQIEDTMPMSVFLLGLAAYFTAVTNHLSRVLQLAGLGYAFITVLFTALWVVKNKKNMFDGVKSFASVYKSPGLMVFAMAVTSVLILFRSHFVTNWDDFNYWAMFSKNIFARNGMVSGASSCTAFKDYTPVVQLMYYAVFKSLGAFSEAWMFMVNNVLLLVCMLPFLKKGQGERIVKWLLRAGAALLFPLAAMFQQLHCLGVDCILSVLFGYLLVRIFMDDKRDLFFCADIAVASCFLMLTKSAGVLLVSMVLICLLVKEGVGGIKAAAAFVPSYICLASWRIFCRLAGNTSYLTDKAAGSLSSAGFLKFPDYSGEFFAKFGKAMLFFRLNGGVLSVTPILCLIFSAAAIWIIPGMNRAEAERRGVRRGALALFAGFLIYIISLIYTYLFVFEKWEALSLSSFDRYISIYILGMMYAAVYALLSDALGADGTLSLRAGCVIVLVFLLTINYPLVIRTFAPGGYERMYESVKTGREAAMRRAEEFYADTPGALGGRVLIVNATLDNELEKYQQYEMVPTVTFIYHLDEQGEDGIEEQMEDHSLDYVFRY